MIYQEGYVYHIKDEYFEKVQDSNLMQNKEGGTYRPTFYCLRDNKTSLLWMVPLSSRVEKFKAIHDKQVAKYGKCLTIVGRTYSPPDKSGSGIPFGARALCRGLYPLLQATSKGGARYGNLSYAS